MEIPSNAPAAETLTQQVQRPQSVENLGTTVISNIMDIEPQPQLIQPFNTEREVIPGAIHVNDRFILLDPNYNRPS